MINRHIFHMFKTTKVNVKNIVSSWTLNYVFLKSDVFKEMIQFRGLCRVSHKSHHMRWFNTTNYFCVWLPHTTDMKPHRNMIESDKNGVTLHESHLNSFVNAEFSLLLNWPFWFHWLLHFMNMMVPKIDWRLTQYTDTNHQFNWKSIITRLISWSTEKNNYRHKCCFSELNKQSNVIKWHTVRNENSMATKNYKTRVSAWKFYRCYWIRLDDL